MAWRFIDKRRAVVLGVALLGLVPAAAAHAGDLEEARALNEKATAAFALGHYPAAADYFEKAFELKPDPALLYDAAQAHRLAGNRERALSLYQSYLRVYGRAAGEKRPEIEARIRELKQAIEHDKAASAAASAAVVPPPVVAPEPAPARVPPASAPAMASAAPAAPAVAPSRTTLPAAEPAAPPPPVLVARPERPDAGEPPLTRRPWFWAVAGSVVVVAAATVLAIGLRGSSAASPSIGKVPGN
jgi:hypothetical protein